MRYTFALIIALFSIVSSSFAQQSGVTVRTNSNGTRQVALASEDMNERVTAARLSQALGYSAEDSIEIVVMILPAGRVTGSYQSRYTYLTDNYQPLNVDNPFGRATNGAYYAKTEAGQYELVRSKNELYDGKGIYFWRSIRKSDL